MAFRLGPLSRLGASGMPLVGLGTWQSTPEEIDIALNAAIDEGYRQIDTAYAYMNEKAIGQSLRKIFASGKVKREDLFIVTKLPHIAISAKYVETYIKRSLESLELEYLDLYLVHNPVGLKNRGDELFPKDENGELELDMETDHVALWKAMEAQVAAGRTKQIGVSNFNLRQVKRLVETGKIPPANNQVELHVYLQQKELVAYCKEKGITITAYAPLGSPHLPNFNTYLNSKIQWKSRDAPMEDPVVLEIAERLKKTPAQVLLRFLLESGMNVIPKSTNPERIRQNFQVFDLELSGEDMRRLRGLDRGERGRMFADSNDFFAALKKHPEYPYGS